MAISSETYNKDLYSLLKTKGYRPIPLDFARERTDPEEAVVFEFEFKKDGESYGTAYVSVNKDVTVYYDEEQEESPSSPTKGLDYDDTWSGFLEQMKYWAMSKQLGFETSNKDRLGDDLAQRKYTMDKEKINEGYYPMGKTASYNDAVPTVKIILQHTRQIQEGEQRFRNVAKIFLENQLGERILAPTTRPGIAQVYARHLAEGGVPNDERWNHIKGLCEEYSKMAGFVRAVKNHEFNESAQQLVSEGVNHYTNLRETLSRMRGQRGYNTYFESWTPTLMEDESSDNTLNELFVQETLDPRIESVLPILSKLRKSVVEMKEVDELAEWADNLTEAPGAMTLKHNQDTEKSNLKAFDLEEDDVQDELKAAELARKKMKLPPSMREPLSIGDIEASKKHPSSSGVVGRLADEPKKTTEEKDVEDTDLEMKLSQLTKAPDMFDAIYDALTSDDELGQHLQDMYFDIAREHRFHLDDDFEDIILKMADQLEHYYGEQDVAEGSNELDQQALAIADKLTTGKNLEKLRSMVHDSTVYRALDRYFAKHNVPETIYNRVAYIVFKKINQQGVAEGSEDYQEIFQMNTKQGKAGAVVQYKDKSFGFIYGTKLSPTKFARAREAEQALNAYHNKQGVAEGDDDLVDLGPALRNLTGEFNKFKKHDARMKTDPAYAEKWNKRYAKYARNNNPEDDEQGVREGFFGNMANKVKSAFSRKPTNFDARGTYPDGSSLRTPGVDEWKKQFQQAVMAVKNAKTQQEYEAASDRAGRIKELLASRGVQVGPILGAQGVAEGSEQTNESLDRLLYLANIETSKKKVDESIKSIVDTGSFSVEPSPIDRIDQVGGQDMSFDEEIRANTIKHLLQKDPSLKQEELKEKPTSVLISMLNQYLMKGVAEGLNEMDKSAPQPGRDGRVSHSTYGSRDKKGSDYFTGKEALGKPVTAKKAAKDALDILKKLGVGEGEFAGHYKTGPKGQLGPTEKAKNISPVIGQKEKQHPFHGKLVGNESVEYDPLDDIKKLMGK